MGINVQLMVAYVNVAKIPLQVTLLMVNITAVVILHAKEILLEMWNVLKDRNYTLQKIVPNNAPQINFITTLPFLHVKKDIVVQILYSFQKSALGLSNWKMNSFLFVMLDMTMNMMELAV